MFDVFPVFQEWLINKKERLVYGMKLPTGFQLIGHVVSTTCVTRHDYPLISSNR